MPRFPFASLFLLGFASSAFSAPPGFLEISGKKVDITHVYARKAPATFEKDKESLFILAVDRELAPEVRVDPDAVRSLYWDKKLNGFEIEVTDNGASWMVKSAMTDGASISGSRSPNPFPLEVSGDRVKGKVEFDQREDGRFKVYTVFDVDAAIERKAPEPEPTPADRAAAAKSEATKTYMALQTALMKGDKAGMMKLVDPEKAKMIDTPEFPQMLKMIQSMQPKNIVVLKATEKGETAELIVSGNGGKERGKVLLERDKGQWFVMKESWGPARK